jgi:outer membrane protein OmpA-like peptidoglycan-associated protein
MRTSSLTTLILLATVSASAVMAQDAEAEQPLTELAEEVMDTDMKDGDAMSEDMADGAMPEDMKDGEEMAEETPDLAEIAAADPNLEVRLDEDGEVDAMVMLSDVLFGFGDATLEPAALDVLAGMAEKLDGIATLEITGHTDAVGDDQFNLALGQRRADAVRDWLVANTVLTADVLTAKGMGEANPIAPNLNDDGTDNPDGRAANRRVEFTIPDAG